ncbi:hypothetical protein GP486_002585, partial [Trichoglossum hirsutum]
TLRNGTLYIDGGLETFVQNNTNSNFNGSLVAGYNNYLIMVDMSDSWDWKVNVSQSYVAKAENPATGTEPPIVVDGALFQGSPTDSNIYLYGGTTSFWNTSFPKWQPPTSFQYVLWSFDTISKVWNQFDVSNVSPYRPSGGSWADAPDLSLAFYLGGIINNGSQITTANIGNNSHAGVPGMIVIDTKSQSARNVSTAELTGNNPRSRGNMVYVPHYGDKGLLVTIGGSYKAQSDLSDDVIGTLIPLDTIEVFDVASLDNNQNGKWYKQKTSGDIPPPRIDACAVVASAPDNSSHNIYIYGGRNVTGIYDQIYVLSIPSFTWTKIFEGQSPRFGMTCHLAAKRQLITVGGWSDFNLTKGCDWEDKGLGVYDLSSLIWGSRFNAYAKDYTVPTPVVSVIGGSTDGAATMTSPLAGYTNPAFGHLFDKSINPNPQNATASSTSKPNKGAIAGGVVGGVAALAIVGGAIAFFIRRRRRPLSISAPAPAELSGSTFAQPIQEKDASQARPDVDAELVAQTGHYVELPADRGVEIMGYTQKPKTDTKDDVEEKDEKDHKEQDYKDVPMI